MAASLKDKRTPITTPPYQVPSVDVTPDPPIFSLVTTFKVVIWIKVHIQKTHLTSNLADEVTNILTPLLFLPRQFMSDL